MRVRWGIAGAVTAAAMAATSAYAIERPSAYLAAGGGVDFMRDMDYSGLREVGRAQGGAPLFAPATGKIDGDMGWGILGAIGYRWAEYGLRTELEGSYHRNGTDFDPGSIGGKISMYGGMLNILKDFAMENQAIAPYIGGGAGVMHGDFDFGAAGTSDDLAFAYQGIAGLSYDISEKAQLFADYRYIATSGLQTRLGGLAGNDEWRSHSIMAGLRWTFWAPAKAAPAPAPAPVAAQPREFIIYYEFDKSNITEAAGAVLDEIKTYTTPNSNPVDVTGHTDTSGSPEYNEALSERRAKSAAEGLTTRGVKVDAVTWQGENAPAVATGDGVKEPLNRRSVITVKGPQPGPGAAAPAAPAAQTPSQ